MRFDEAKPFVRQAIITMLNSRTKYDVFYELRSSDCRLFYIISGKGSMMIEGETYSLLPGCTICFSSGTRYIWQTVGDESVEFIVINFDYTQNFSHIKKSFHPVHSDRFSEDDILERVTFSDTPVLASPIVLYNMTALESRLRLMTTEFNVAPDLYLAELLSLVLKSVLVSIIREKLLDKEHRKNKELTRDIIEYIQNNYEKVITYESLSGIFHMNPVYINRIFKKNAGTSLHSFLVGYRINMAMELLRTTSLPVREIALMVGFTELPHFIKTFKKITGSTPGKYRNSADESVREQK